MLPHTAVVRVAASIVAIDLGDQTVGLLATDRSQDGVELGLDPIIALFGLRRTDMEQEGEAADLPEQLQALSIPSLQSSSAGSTAPARKVPRLGAFQDA